MKTNHFAACLGLLLSTLSPKVGHTTANEAALVLDFKTSSSQTYSFAEGPRTGGGGNLCALGIIRQTEALLQALNVIPKHLSKGQIQAVSKAAKTAKFYQANDLSLRGESKDAINYPDAGKVYFSKSFCEKMEGIIAGPTLALLLHEYLGLAKIDDTNYTKSKMFLKSYYKEQERVREGSNVFGTFAGDVPEKPIKNERRIPVSLSRCQRQALEIANAMSVAKPQGKVDELSAIKRVDASEQYYPEGDAFEKVETYYIEGVLRLLVTLTSDECAFVTMSQVYE